VEGKAFHTLHQTEILKT